MRHTDNRSVMGGCGYCGDPNGWHNMGCPWLHQREATAPPRETGALAGEVRGSTHTPLPNFGEKSEGVSSSDMVPFNPETMYAEGVMVFYKEPNFPVKDEGVALIPAFNECLGRGHMPGSCGGDRAYLTGLYQNFLLKHETVR